MFDLLKNYKLNTISFYNTKSTMKLSISLFKGTIMFYMAKALPDANFSGIAKEGEKRYDHENSVTFSMNVREAYEFLKFMKGGSGEYKIMHGTNSTLYGNYIEGKNNKVALKVSVNSNGKNVGYILSPTDKNIFTNFLTRFVQEFPYDQALFDGCVKFIKKMMYDVSVSNNSNKNVSRKKNDVSKVVEEDDYEGEEISPENVASEEKDLDDIFGEN